MIGLPAGLGLLKPPSASEYNYFKINITANNGYTLMTQITTIRLYDKSGNLIHPVMTTETTPAPFVVSASGSYAGGSSSGISKPFDANTTTWWGTAGGVTGWIMLYIGTIAKSFGSIYIESAIAANRAAKDFTVQLSTNGSSFETALSVVGNTSAAATFTAP